MLYINLQYVCEVGRYQGPSIWLPVLTNSRLLWLYLKDFWLTTANASVSFHSQAKCVDGTCFALWNVNIAGNGMRVGPLHAPELVPRHSQRILYCWVSLFELKEEKSALNLQLADKFGILSSQNIANFTSNNSLTADVYKEHKMLSI